MLSKLLQYNTHWPNETLFFSIEITIKPTLRMSGSYIIFHLFFSFFDISRHRNTHRMMHCKEILPFSLGGNGGLLIDHFVTFSSFFHDRMDQFLSYSQDMFFQLKDLTMPKIAIFGPFFVKNGVCTKVIFSSVSCLFGTNSLRFKT